jgi:hypothetical protein
MSDEPKPGTRSKIVRPEAPPSEPTTGTTGRGDDPAARAGAMERESAAVAEDYRQAETDDQTRIVKRVKGAERHCLAVFRPVLEQLARAADAAEAADEHAVAALLAHLRVQPPSVRRRIEEELLALGLLAILKAEVGQATKASTAGGERAARGRTP